MKLTKLNEQEIPLLNRKRINYIAEFEDSTPSKKEILDSLVKSLKINEELIAIRHIYQKFGDTKAKVIVHVYKNKEDLKKLEKKSKKAGEKPKKVPKEVKENAKEKSKEQDSK